MSFPNAVLTAFLLVQSITEITGTVCSYTAPPTHNIADVAHMSEFALAIRSTDQHWYREGIRLFAYKQTGLYWEKAEITWAITDSPNPSRMDKTRIENVIEECFEMWAVVTPFTFDKVVPEEEPDIRISFKMRGPTFISHTALPRGPTLNDRGVRIVFGDTVNWTNGKGERWNNFWFAALHEIGHALGLADSDSYGSVMYKEHQGFRETDYPELTDDDIDGIQSIYGPP